jgi:transposase
MLTLPSSTRVFVATQPADMRRSFDGLLAIVRDFLGHQDPFTGHLFVFRNKRGDRLKVLWWDRDGLALFYKRLEEGVFTLPQAAADSKQLEMTAADLQLVLQGIDPAKVQRAKRYTRPNAPPITNGRSATPQAS